MTAEKVGVLIDESREVVVRGTAGPASVGNGEFTRGEAPAGIVIWKLWGVGGVSGTGVPALLLKEDTPVGSLVANIVASDPDSNSDLR